MLEAVKTRPDSTWDIYTSKSLLSKVTTESPELFKRFWDALCWGSLWTVDSVGLTNSSCRANRDGWMDLLEFSKMSDEEWVASFEESDDSGEEEGDG